jgi:tRNA(Arg) A34 adenosine deaminase TadA
VVATPPSDQPGDRAGERALNRAWERALELAWESFCGGTTPVGAVVTDAAGAIVTEGRGRRFETTAPPRQLAWTPVAHAELNALAQLAPDRHYPDHALLTTLEPCLMCHGAAVQSSLGSLAYAGADPYGGSGRQVFGTPQARRGRLRVTGPLPDERGRLSELLHITWIMRAAGPHVLAAQQQARPDLTALAARPATQRLLTEAATTRTPLPNLRSALAALL